MANDHDVVIIGAGVIGVCVGFELAKRGAPEAVIDEALESLPESDLEATRAVAEAWLRRGKVDPMALARHLDRKGFSSGSILTVVDEMRVERQAGEGD